MQELYHFEFYCVPIDVSMLEHITIMESYCFEVQERDIMTFVKLTEVCQTGNSDGCASAVCSRISAMTVSLY